jgi:hypothetical protein
MAQLVLISGVFKYAFSLAAILLAVRFFRTFESIWARMGFIFATIFLSFLIPIVYFGLALAFGWNIDPKYLEGVSTP